MAFASLARRTMFVFRTRIGTKPRLDALIKQVLVLFPPLEVQLRTLVRDERAAEEAEADRIGVDEMPPHAYRVYQDLIDALKQAR